MIQIEKYCPIDKDMVKKRWDKIMNIPNNEWEERNLDREIDLINNTNIPKTLRLIQLNMLPVLFIQILNESL